MVVQKKIYERVHLRLQKGICDWDRRRKALSGAYCVWLYTLQPSFGDIYLDHKLRQKDELHILKCCNRQHGRVLAHIKG